MADEDLTKLLGGWEGFEVVGVTRQPAEGGRPVPRIVLELRPVPGFPKRCSRCGEVVMEIHDVAERRVRDLPVFDWDTWLVFPRARLECPRCGPTVEAVPWLDRYQRMTTRLAEAIARLAMVLPIKHVAEWFRVGWDTLERELVLTALPMALRHRQPARGVLHHSDRGSQYASEDYRALLTAHGLKPSMSARRARFPVRAVRPQCRVSGADALRCEQPGT